MKGMTVLAAAFAAGLAAVSARADHAFGKKDLRDGAWRTDGVPAGTYYVRYGVTAGGGRGLTLDGRPVDFTHGGPWETRDGKEFMVIESGPVEVRPGQAFRPGEKGGDTLVLAEKPLAFAPQRFFTNTSVSLGDSCSIDGAIDATNFTATVKNVLGSPQKVKVTLTVTDYWQRELAREERTVELADALTVSVPYRDSMSGQLRGRVDVRDASGADIYRVFPRVADSRGRFREALAMNAGWERATVKDDGTRATREIRRDPPEKAKWQKVTFPAEITGSLAWFRCTREVPASFAGRRVFFKTLRMVGEAELYVDGAKAAELGKDFNFNGHLEADVTAFVKPGTRQEFLIAARHADWAAADPAELDRKSPDRSKDRFFRGLTSAFSELELEARPAAALGAVKVSTSFREKRIAVAAERPAGYTVRNSVWLRDEKLLEFGEESKWENPPLWGPTEFPLLRLVTELVDGGGAVVDEKCTRFGFREIWGEGMALMWNGHPVRGDARAFMTTWSWQFDRRCQRQHNVDEIVTGKRRGVKFMRHIYNSSELLDFCDELGLVVAKGGMTISGPSPEKSANRACWAVKEANDRAMIASHFNHPSVMTWYLTNEYYAQGDGVHFKPVAAAVRNARAADPTRFVEAGCDIDLRGESNVISTHYPAELGAFRDFNCYMPDCFYWRPLDRSFEKGMKVPCGQSRHVANVHGESPITWGEKPICINETCWDYFFGPPFGYTRTAGDEVFEDPSFNDGKWHIETDIEAVRGHRDANAVLWTTWRWFSADPIWRVSPEVDIVPIQRYSRFYEGTEVAFDVNAFYDVWKPARLTWFWRLEDVAGRTVLAGEETAHDADTSAFYRKRIAFRVPKAGAYAVRCGFRGLRETTFPVVSCPREVVPAASNVIAADAPLSTNLLARAASGETIVVLAREDYPSWLPEITAVTRNSAAILRTFRPSHPVLKGISADDLRYFYPRSIASRHAFAKPTAGNARTLIEAGGPSGLVYSSLVEVPYGKGCFLYSRLVLEPDANPVAARLLANMSAYRRTSEPGAALYLAGKDPDLAKALRVRYGITLEPGGLSAAAKSAAVVADGSRGFSKDEIAALESCGRTVFVFNPGPEFGLATRKVKAKTWRGRAVKAGCDPLTEGLTNQDLMWRTKYGDANTAAADLAADEFVTGTGALLYPVYAMRRGNLVFLTADPKAYRASVAPVQKRFWATLFANAGVKVTPFERPSLPKNLFYDFVDLAPFLDRTLEDEKDNDGVGSWNDQGMAQYLPMKFRGPTAWVGMVPYDVKREGPCAFALSTEFRKGGVSNVVVRVGRRADTVNWLFSAAWTSREKTHYRARLRYADGTSATVIGKGGDNVQDCFSPRPDFSEETDTITSSRGFPTKNPVFPTAQVYSTTFVNPHPEKTIDAVEFERGERRCARIGVFALTLGSRTSEYAGRPAAELDALHAKLVAEALEAQKAKDPFRAIASYEKAIRVRPGLVWVYRSIGAIYESLGDWEDALTTYRRSLEADFNQPDMWDAEKRMKAKLGLK